VNLKSTIAVALAAFWALLFTGCSSTPVTEPESDYIEMRPLIYDYGTVFDCVAEAITEEGLPVQEADRVKGTIETNYIPGKEDRLKNTQEGSRVKARVVKTGPKDFIVRMAATRYERDIRDNQPAEWHYLGSDEALLDKLRKRFDKQVDKRYKAASDKGG
jgi:ribosomal protein S1